VVTPNHIEAVTARVTARSMPGLGGTARLPTTLNGEALWTYLTTPFLLAGDGVHVEETEPWKQDGETWRVRARFPGSVETHSRIQDFFFDDSGMLRRHDYQVNIAGGFPAAQLTSEHVRVDGISLPTKRRAYTRGPDRRPILDMLMVTMDFSDVKFS
jgi:hypothetical protein